MMTTTLATSQPAVPVEGELRILRIAADLLPVEIVESRRTRKVRRIVLAGLVVFAVLLGGWYARASQQTSAARASLSSAEDEALRLLRQQRAFADVVRVQAESQAVRVQLSALLAGDLPWSRLLSSLRRAAPTGVQVSSVTGTVTVGIIGGAGDAGAEASRLPDTSGEKSVGTLIVAGSGTDKAAVAAYVDALAELRGLGNPLLGDVTQQDGAVRFTVRLDITGSALGGRYTAKSATGTGGS
jgi:Tfp pilus assembly protein PilN